MSLSYNNRALVGVSGASRRTLHRRRGPDIVFHGIIISKKNTAVPIGGLDSKLNIRRNQAKGIEDVVTAPVREKLSGSFFVLEMEYGRPCVAFIKWELREV